MDNNTAKLILKDGFRMEANSITVWQGPNNTLIITGHYLYKCPNVQVIDAKRFL